MTLAMLSKSVRVYEVTPDTRLFENLGATGQPAYKAIAEFTDNSVDNRIPGERVTVNISYEAKNNKITRIVVEDDASGMTEESLVKAFTIGHSNKTDQKKIGRFGMGLKTAISALGNAWTVTTATKKCRTAHQVQDTKKRLVDSKQWTVEVAEVEKTMPINAEHGTRIEITQTEHLNATTFARNLQVQLGSLFRYFIQDGTLALYVNDELVEPASVELINESVIELNTEINGKSVRGWIGLRQNGSSTYGFSLVRNSRVMEEEVKLGFLPHPSVNRIVGDIHLDEFDTDHHKTAFNKNNDDWAQFAAYVTEQVKPLVDMARNLANKDNKRLTPLMERTLNDNIKQLLDAIRNDDLLNQITSGLRESLDGDVYRKPEQDRGPILGQDDRDRNDETERQRQPKKAQPYNGLNIRWQCLNDGEGAPRKRWELIENDLVVTINTEHPTWPEDGASLSWVFQNVMEAVAGYHSQMRAAEVSNDTEPSLNVYDEALDRMYRIAAKQNLIY